VRVCAVCVCAPLQEFEELEEGSDVYKLVGPILVKQSVDEAKVDVERRLEFINSEM
jgi:prefoldin beta subunit